ncbi:MAG TPA: tetratricopeptide repeat protein [Thermodesulfovibrionales bacterium]|nr:tetratricopeptide repeat protein [Thermodesulfovibrionales bacterium]
MRRWLALQIVAVLIAGTASVAAADYAAGMSLYKKHRYAACIQELRRYTETTPDPRAYYLMGYASYKRGDLSGARENFGKAYLIDPNFRPSSLEIKNK